MKKIEFLEELEELLQTENKLNETSLLKEIPEWDSLASIAIISMFDQKFQIGLNMENFKNITTVGDLIELTNNQVK